MAGLIFLWNTAPSGSPVTVTPGTASLVTTKFAPNVTVGVRVTPGAASLTATRFAPTVTATNHQTVTPGVASLTTTRFAPSVAVGVRVIPGTASLALNRFAPTVAATNHQTVTPGVASLITTRFAPTVGIGVMVTPGVATLALTTFAPNVSRSSTTPSGGYAVRTQTQEEKKLKRIELGILPPESEERAEQALIQAVQAAQALSVAKPETQAATEALQAQERAEKLFIQAYLSVYPALEEARILETLKLEAQLLLQEEEFAIVLAML